MKFNKFWRADQQNISLAHHKLTKTQDKVANNRSKKLLPCYHEQIPELMNVSRNSLQTNRLKNHNNIIQIW